MNNQTSFTEFFSKISRINAIVSRKLEGPMNGIGWSDFLILEKLYNAPSSKMRRIDLAEAIGLTASGVTRSLLPMEKIGLVKRESSENDARVSLVSITDSGRGKFLEARQEVEYFFGKIISENEMTDFNQAKEFVTKISEKIL